MSKLLNIYTNLKEKDSSTLYLFKVGLFYNFLNNDAITISNLVHLKVTNLSPSIVKCGFPVNSLEKYLNLFNSLNLNIKIIDSIDYNTVYNVNDYKLNSDIKDLFNKILNTDIESLSIQEAYSFLEDLQNEVLHFNYKNLGKSTWNKKNSNY